MAWLESPDQVEARVDDANEVVVHDGPKSNPVALVVLVVGALILGRKLNWDAAKQEIVGDEEARRLMSRPQMIDSSLGSGPNLNH